MMLSMQFLLIDDKQISNSDQFSEKVNLILREVGHQLLLISGNDKQQIPPVQNKNENTFILKLDAKLNYDTLPYLLNNSLISHNINRPYHVLVKECMEDVIILGYTLQSFENRSIPCLGREMESECNAIEIVFTENKAKFGLYRYISGGLGILGVLSFVWLFFLNKRSISNQIPKNEEDHLLLGSLKFDHQNLTIGSSVKTKKLTYRESKLLLAFATQPNQVLTREQLLEQVWGDEGILVGRSLDVFVSRLRKIISLDPNLQIKNVHGVGYKLVL